MRELASASRVTYGPMSNCGSTTRCPRPCRFAELTLGDAARLATANPGRLVPGRGRLVPGAPADLLLFDHCVGDTSLRIRQVISSGRVLP